MKNKKLFQVFLVIIIIFEIVGAGFRFSEGQFSFSVVTACLAVWISLYLAVFRMNIRLLSDLKEYQQAYRRLFDKSEDKDVQIEILKNKLMAAEEE